MTKMHNIRWGIGAALISLAALASACSSADAEPTAAAAPSAMTQADREARGDYLVHAMGCNDCHTPLTMGPNGPEPDMTRFLSGHPEQVGAHGPAPLDGHWLFAAGITGTSFSGPWGISYAANLTPDQNTGLGIWTEDMFVHAIRDGKHMGVSRPILPPMPWPVFRNLNDDDLTSIYAYLRTITPISNHVPDPLIAEPAAAAVRSDN